MNQGPAQVFLWRRPNAVAERMRKAAGFGDAGGDSEWPCGRLGELTPMRFKGPCECSSQQIKIGSRRNVNGLRGEATQLIVGENIDSAGAGLARRQAIWVGQPEETKRMAVRDEYLIEAQFGADAFHRGVGSEGDHGVGSAERFLIQSPVRIDKFTQRCGQAANELEEFTADGGIIAVAGKFDGILRSENDTVNDVGYR